MKVVCCYAGKYFACKSCKHSSIHDTVDFSEKNKCTQWGSCDLTGNLNEKYLIKVRCIKIKKA